MEKNFEIDAPEAALAQAFAGLAGDLAFVLDAEGQVLAAAGGAAASRPGDAAGDGGGIGEDWTGRPWRELAAPDSRGKAEALLTEALRDGQSRRREMNLCRRAPSARSGPSETVTFSCSALRLRGDLRAGRVLVVGRDLQAAAAMQQQLLARQAELETAYWAGPRVDPRV